MEDDEEVCNTTLDLGIGLSEFVPKRDHDQKNKRVFFLDLSIPLNHATVNFDHKIDSSGSGSGSSSLKVKCEDNKQAGKDIDFNGSEEDERNYEKNYSRKKLRLSKEQTILLEDTFKQHTTLNTLNIIFLRTMKLFVFDYTEE
ncbi:homeobox-leucine zipper protein HAT9-like [Forsythia ovata]|uniref:Homeobox-leucine zipper protein HAT9-like n=1 Tax=Forsythia ovata TaxID=205694 RepID=A0ABD1R3B7_9LAMI